jgi:hypothetical protein
LKVYDSFVYLGFDGKLIRQKVMNKLKTPDDQRKLSHIFVIYGTRGSNLQKARAVGKMKPDGLALLEAAVSHFDIKVSVNGIKLAPSDVTLSRIVCAFAHLIAQMIIHLGDKFRSPVAKNAVPGLPAYYQFPQAPSIIPLADEAMFDKWKEWSKKFSEVIWNRLPEERRKEMQINQAGFQNATRNSTLYSEDERVAIDELLRKLSQSIKTKPANVLVSTPFTKKSGGHGSATVSSGLDGVEPSDFDDVSSSLSSSSSSSSSSSYTLITLRDIAALYKNDKYKKQVAEALKKKDAGFFTALVSSLKGSDYRMDPGLFGQNFKLIDGYDTLSPMDVDE